MKKSDDYRLSQKRPEQPDDNDFLLHQVRKSPIGACYRTARLDSIKTGIILVVRDHPDGTHTAGLFLVDFYCKGVQDVLSFVRISPEELEELIDQAGNPFELQRITYEEAHNRIFRAVEYAAQAGIAPCDRFEVARHILKEDDGSIPPMDFDFGNEGMHCLLAANQADLDRYLPLLEQHLGDRFSYHLVDCLPGGWGGNDGEEEDFDDYEEMDDDEWEDEDFDDEEFEDDDFDDEEFDDDEFEDDDFDEDDFDDEDFDEELDDDEELVDNEFFIAMADEPWKDREQTHHFQFRVTIQGLHHPDVWRTISVPSRITFSELAYIILRSLLWDGNYQWMFSPQGWGSHPVIARGSGDTSEVMDLDADVFLITNYFERVGQQLVFVYGFGKKWQLDIVLEQMTEDTSERCFLVNSGGMSPLESTDGPEDYQALMADLGFSPEEMTDTDWEDGEEL